MTRPLTTIRAEALDNAWTVFLDGERDGDAFVAAYDYREDGYDIAVEAFASSDPEAFIEAALDETGAPDSARDLIAAAAWFRLAELERDDVRRAAA